jgi:hypothetical protein
MWSRIKDFLLDLFNVGWLLLLALVGFVFVGGSIFATFGRDMIEIGASLGFFLFCFWVFVTAKQSIEEDKEETKARATLSELDGKERKKWIAALEKMPSRTKGEDWQLGVLHEFQHQSDQKISKRRKTTTTVKASSKKPSNAKPRKSKQLVDENSIENLAQNGLLKNRIGTALKNSGIADLSQLANLSDDELIDLPGIGPAAISDIRTLIKARGL